MTKNKEFCSVSPIKLIPPEEVFNSANPLPVCLTFKETPLSPDCRIMGGKKRESRTENDAEFLSPLFSHSGAFMCLLSRLPLLHRPPSCSASVPIEMSNAAVVCKWKRGSLVGTGCPSNLKASAVLFSPFWCFPSHFLSRCCVGQHRL